MLRSLFFTAILLCFFNSTYTQTINDLTGINVVPDDPREAMAKFSWVRVFHDWGNDVGYPSTGDAKCLEGTTAGTTWGLQWNPSYFPNGVLLNYDEFYGNLNGTVIPVLKGIAPEMRGFANYPDCPNYAPLEQKPFCLPDYTNPNPFNCHLPPLGDLPTLLEQIDPETYNQHALWLSLFAARYGSNSPLSTNFISPYLSNGETSLINLQTISYLEDNNEPNKNWYDDGIPGTNIATGATYWFFTPQQYAAMFKADYDGNNSGITIDGQPLGITNVTENVKVAMGGLAGLNGLYVEEMLDPTGVWGTNPPEFIANFHHYCNTQTATQQTETEFKSGEYDNYGSILFGGDGVSPEDDNLRQKLFWLKEKLSLAEGADNIQEYWFTEFGYDSFPEDVSENSSVNAPPISGDDGDYDSQKVQGQWLIRGVLETAWSRAINKMVLYELLDKQDFLGDLSYAYSGVMTQEGLTKRAWYYLMTLKNTLGEFEYNEEIYDGFDADPDDMEEALFLVSSPNDVRIYEFRKGDDIVYAIWSPTSTAIAPFNCSITFPNFGDYGLNGQATLIEIQELNELGIRTNWSSNISNQTISNIPVSETPVFLVFNKNLGDSPTVEHIKNLECEPACCRSVKLSWDIAGEGISQITKNTLIFYREKEIGTPCPDFDFTRCTLFENNIGYAKNQAIVTNLEPNKEYCFYVFPVHFKGNVPADLTDPAAVCSTVTSDCSDCWIDITEQELGFDPDYPTLNPAGLMDIQNQAKDVFFIEEPITGCSDIFSGCDVDDFTPQGWQHYITPADNCGNQPCLDEPNTVYINFNTPKDIDAIYIQDWTGNGRFRVEYTICGCDNTWFSLPVVDLRGTPTCYGESGSGATGDYEMISIPFLGNSTITRLRFTRVDPFGTVRRIAICGSDKECPSGGYEASITPEGANDLKIEELKTNSATIKWNTTPVIPGNYDTPFIEKFALKLGQQLDLEGNIVDGIDIEVESFQNEMEVIHRLDGLAPNTTYFVELNADGNPCGIYTDPRLKIKSEFTTPSGKDSELSDRQNNDSDVVEIHQSETQYRLFVNPNPVSDEVKISIDNGNIHIVHIMDNSGKILRTKSNIGNNEIQLNIENMPNGVYWVRTIREDGLSKTGLMMKQ